MEKGFKFFQKRNTLFAPFVGLGIITGWNLPPLWTALTLGGASVLIALGIALRIWAIGYLDRRYSGSVYFTADRLITAGPYAHLRNPLYVANLLHALALILINGNPFLLPLWGLMIWFYYHIIQEEEKFLSHRFQEAYAKYAREVPRFFPRWQPFSEPVGEFSWERVRHKEYQSALAPILLGLVFYGAKHIDLLALLS